MGSPPGMTATTEISSDGSGPIALGKCQPCSGRVPKQGAENGKQGVRFRPYTGQNEAATWSRKCQVLLTSGDGRKH